MKWPWVRKRHEPEEPSRNDTQGEDLQEAKAARTTAEHELAKIRENREEVEKIADRLREIRRVNHLAEIFEASLKRRRTGHG